MDGIWRALTRIGGGVPAGRPAGEPRPRARGRRAEDLARAELEEARERLEMALESSQSCVWHVDTAKDEIRLSGNWAAMLGEPPGETVHASGQLALRLHEEDRPAFVSGMLETLKGIRPGFEAQIRVRKADGDWRWFLCRGRVTRRDERGRALTLVGTNTCVTGQRATQDALVASEERYRNLVELLPDAIMIIQNDRVVFSNGAAATLLRAREPSGLPGTSLWMIAAPQYHEEIRGWIARFAGESTGVVREEQVFVCRDGDSVDVEVSATPLVLGGQSALLLLARDITRRKRVERHLRDLQADLERRVEERTAELRATIADLESFSYSISHDLRAPLRAIDGFSHILVEEHGESLDREARTLLARVEENAQMMARLIDGLLDFSRMSRRDLAPGRVDMTALARTAAAQCLADAGADAQAKVVLEIGTLPTVEGDDVLLRQVWVNLLSNAVKFSARVPEPRITVEGEVDGSVATFHVRDNGAGFDMNYAGKLFGVFQRLHSPREFSGTGVGLAIVRRIIDRHGGRIWAESVAGQGARFSFTIPLKSRTSAADNEE